MKSKFHIENGVEKIAEYEVVCGLEIHAQVNSETKLFSRAPNNFGDTPNSNVDFLDISFPGILPLLNEKCVEQAVRTGIALNCVINKTSFFERKHYFYPDLPSGYQISQLQSPICGAGFVQIIAHDVKSKIGINRIQLEQDAGKSIHDMSDKYSFVDLNRAGIPLMEIVSEPDIRSISGAIAYVTKVRSILQYLNTSTARMELGEFRVDANISLRKTGEGFGNRVEIKNVNSIKFLEEALYYECQRQVEILQNGGEIDQETRLFDARNGVTVSMRKKEDALDYRYFRDPDLFPLVLSDDYINKIRNSIPELPEEKCARFMSNFGLDFYKADLIVNDKDVAEYFENTVKYYENVIKNNANIDNFPTSAEFACFAANRLVGEFFALMNNANIEFSGIKVSHENFAKLVWSILSGVVSGKAAKDVLQKMWETNEDPEKIVDQLGLKQVSDEKLIAETVNSVLNENSSELDGYLSGKDKLFAFFVGQIMKKSGGKFDPNVLNNVLKIELDKRKK